MIKPGRYRHDKGEEYEVIGRAGHSETGEKFVVSRVLYGDRGLWARPERCFSRRCRWTDGRFRGFS